MGQDGQGYRDLEGLLALDLLFNRDLDELDWALSEGLLIVQGQLASPLPWPEGLINHFDLFNERGAWACFEDTHGLTLEDSSLIVPGVGFPVGIVFCTMVVVKHTLGVCTHVLTEFFHDFAEFLPLLLLFSLGSVLHGVAEVVLHLLTVLFSAHLVHEVPHHTHEATSSSTWAPAAASTTASPATSASSSKEATETIAAIVGRGLSSLSLLGWHLLLNCVWSVVIDHSNHDIWSSSCLLDF